MSARDIMLDDPDWHAAACAYDGGEIECDCLLPDRLSAIEAEAGPSRGPDLSALDAEIARREAPDYQRFHKPSESQTPAERTGATAVRGIQHGELIGLRLARHLLEYAALDKESEPAR